VPALRPLFAAAGVLLLVAVVLLGVRATDDGSVPSADDLDSPSPTVAQPADPTDDPTGTSEPVEVPTSPTPTEDETDDPSTAGTEDAGTGGTSTGGTSTDGTGTGDGTSDDGRSDDGTGTTDGTSTDDGATGGSDDDAAEGDDDDRTVVAIGRTDGIDDMPDTGGGAASVLGGLLAVGAAAGLGRRRS
jgi:hypothetical protein